MPTTTAAASRWCRCPSRRATSRIMPAGTARVALRQLAPKPYSIERVETLASDRAFPEGNRRLRNRVAVRRRRYRARHRIPGRIGQDDRRSHPDGFRRRRALGAGAGCGGERRGQNDRESVAHPGRHRFRNGPCGRRQGFADWGSPLQLRHPGPRDRSVVRSAGRTPQRYRAAGNIRRAVGRCGATARQAMAAPRDRRGLRREHRYRAAAIGIDLLSHPRAVAVRRRTSRRSRRAATGDCAIPRSAAADDRAGGCRHAVAGNPRAPERLDRPGRRAGAVRRPPSGAGR